MNLFVNTQTMIIGLAILFWVLSIIAYWKLFTKAGEPGWKSIIPIYSTYVLFKIAWKPNMFWVWLVPYVVSAGLAQIANMVVAVIAAILAILSALIGILLYIKLSKAYGKSGAFAVGLFFLWPIFILILGLGDSKYVGAQD